MPLKWTLSAAEIAELAPPLRLLYAQQPDGTHHLDVEPHPDSTKLAEFRENNRSLNAAKTELESRLARFDGIDPEAAKTALKAASIENSDALKTAEAALASERAAHAQTALRNAVALEFLAIGGQPDALDFVVSKAASLFAWKDGGVSTAAFSKLAPGEPLPLPEWLTEQAAGPCAFAFKPSKGGGAPAQGRGPAPRKTISGDAAEFGKNLEGIAKGEVAVVND